MLFADYLNSQSLIDQCFLSADTGTDFQSTLELANVRGKYFGDYESADLLLWNGVEWEGGWSHANITIAPPRQSANCRAIWMGHGDKWTDGGEGFGIKFSNPVSTGEIYEIEMNYVSHGTLSDGSFDPAYYTSPDSSIAAADSIGRLPPAGSDWKHYKLILEITESQNGHEWLIFHTGYIVSSGMISSFCPECINCSEMLELGPDPIICDESDLNVDVSQYALNSTYLWSNGATTPSIIIEDEGEFYVDILTPECSATDTINVEVITEPIINLGNDASLCEGDKVVLNASFPYSEFYWNTGSVEPTITATEKGVYYVTVINDCGASTDSIQLFCQKIQMPNVFTPNADGFNDVFAPLIYEDIIDAELIIFNRWGREVFRTKDIEEGWNGDINGMPAESGLYNWVISYRNIHMDLEYLKGAMSLLR